MIDRQISLGAAGFVIAREHGDALQQGRFAGAVLADDDGDGAIETQLEIVAQERQAERIGLAVGDPRRLEPDAPEIRRRQVDRLVSSCHARTSPAWIIANGSRECGAPSPIGGVSLRLYHTRMLNFCHSCSERNKNHLERAIDAERHLCPFRKRSSPSKQVVCSYEGRPRELCPHIIGTNRKGEEVVLAWQFGGESCGKLPQWRCLRLAEVKRRADARRPLVCRRIAHRRRRHASARSISISMFDVRKLR